MGRFLEKGNVLRKKVEWIQNKTQETRCVTHHPAKSKV